MEVRYVSPGSFEIKAKEGTAFLGQTPTLGKMRLDSPGEYEVGGLAARFYPDWQLLEAEGLRLLRVGVLKRKLSDEELEVIGSPDVVFVPVGAKGLTAQAAEELLSALEPRIVVPTGNGDLGTFLKVEGATPKTEDVLKVTRSTLPQEERWTVVLSHG